TTSWATASMSRPDLRVSPNRAAFRFRRTYGGRYKARWQPSSSALALDPTSAALNGMLSSAHWLDARFGWWDDRETALAKARIYADRALELDPENADAFTASSIALTMTGQYDEAVAHARRAVELAPGLADAAHFASFVLASAGYAKEAVGESKRAMALNPNYPPYYLGNLGYALRLAGQVEE